MTQIEELDLPIDLIQDILTIPVSSFIPGSQVHVQLILNTKEEVVQNLELPDQLAFNTSEQQFSPPVSNIAKV